MKSKAFRFHSEARKDLRQALEWYREQSPRAALEFRIAVSSVILHIVQAPHRWPTYLYQTRRAVMRRFPFSVVYMDDSDVVSIVAVAHNKRRPGYWRDRL
jgi:plasmid stabilization system protein ParE